MKQQLTIISVPYQRLIRVLMGKHILEPLLEMSDVVVIAPFSCDERFKQQFECNGLSFLEWNKSEKTRPFFDRLYNLSEMLRTHGYWVRNRKNDMLSYLLLNSVVSW